MLIDNVAGEVVAAKSTLRQLLSEKWAAADISDAAINERLASIPSPLVDSEAFLDKMTGLWRYEFGEPFRINGQLHFGTHMWIAVDEFDLAIQTALTRIPAEKRSAYLARLNERAAHRDTLVEMMPGHRLVATAATDFEVEGIGVGNKTIDWLAHHGGRSVRLDVKSRVTDLIHQAARADDGGEMPMPLHDAALMFRSVQEKFVEADPDTVLQGAWIATHIKQNKIELDRAFAAIDAMKVHFAFFGDWESDVNLLVKREIDRAYLMEAFTATQSDRFTFVPL